MLNTPHIDQKTTHIIDKHLYLFIASVEQCGSLLMVG
jgi:hypothetical protein